MIEAFRAFDKDGSNRVPVKIVINPSTSRVLIGRHFVPNLRCSPFKTPKPGFEEVRTQMRNPDPENEVIEAFRAFDKDGSNLVRVKIVIN